MRETPVRLGPLSLLLAVISICLAVLAVLNMTTASADLRLAERYAQTVTARYALEKQGQEALLELSGTESADWQSMGWEQEADGIYQKRLENDGAFLQIRIAEQENGKAVVLTWKQEKEWEEDDRVENLWSGF